MHFKMEIIQNAYFHKDSDMALLSLSQLPNESCNNFLHRYLE